MNFEEFINYYTLNAPQIMWFLGAGASRSAGMPSASDIIWDLKRKQYCLKENREITDNELSNEAVRKKIQNYFDALGSPPLWSEDEYAYYFKLVLSDNPALHQKYLEGKLNPSQVSINSGHRVLAAMMAMNQARILFTSNFDNVFEIAYAFMTGKDLQAFNLNGSYAALNALNNETFPIYAKMHGDFRYFEMKNLPDQLKSNDVEIENCFINACSRYGLVVSGYSGRDKNIMSAFDKALENNNAFPKGLFWITSVQGHIFPAVTALIEKAKIRGINAHIIEADTFDALLSAIWKQLNPKSAEFDQKIRRAIFEIPKISRSTSQGSYPLIRTNAFPIIAMPETCLSIEPVSSINMFDFKQKIIAAQTSAIMVKERTILAWGADEEINKVISKTEIKSSEVIQLKDYTNEFGYNTLMHSFYNRAISRAIIRDKPLMLRKKDNSFYAVISSKHEKFNSIEPDLKKALKYYDYNRQSWVEPINLAGKVIGLADTYWMECVQISFEYFDNRFWIVLVPDIWIEPSINRRDARDFLSNKKKLRFNQTQNGLLDVWKKILFGPDKQVTLKGFNDEVINNAIFTIDTTSAYSFREKQ
jgi:NAD-dependent SIR2 family protein deacetylase